MSGGNLKERKSRCGSPRNNFGIKQPRGKVTGPRRRTSQKDRSAGDVNFWDTVQESFLIFK